ncbi:hypothetical protein JCM11251_004806 [Rhodosporidiobolus azoricus]
MSTAASFSESLRARDERQPTQKTVAEDIVDESRTLAQKQTKVSHVEKKPAEYALPSESDDDGKSRAREEALWARAITEEPPKNGSTEEFSRCCHRFEALYCAYLKQPFSRCLPPTPSFVATLLAGWSRHPVHVLDLRKIKKKEDLKAIRGLLAHSPAPMYLVLVSKIVPPDFVFHDVSNVMLFYIRTLYEYLRLKPGPFGYEAFLAYLAASFPQLLPSNLTYRVLALRPQLMTSIVVETQEKTYRSDADGIFRERNCPPPGAELPPRSFFRKAEDGVAEPWMNPLLLIVDAATKLLAVEMSA